MSNIDRLDFSKPPNGYLVWFDDGWSCVCWGLEDDGQAINTPDDNLTEEAAITASWEHCKARHDPPGMWSGYCAVLPLCDQYRPRMGVSIPGVAHLELYVIAERHGTTEDARAIGRAAAWAWYGRRVAAWRKTSRIVRRTFGETLNGVFAAEAVEGALWPDILTWPGCKMDEHEKQLTSASETGDDCHE